MRDAKGRTLRMCLNQPNFKYYELNNPKEKERVTWWPGDTSEKAGLPVAAHFLHLINKDNPLLQLTNPDLSNLQDPRFSDDGRRLVWGSESGLLTVVDIEKLREEIAAFERQLQEE